MLTPDQLSKISKMMDGVLSDLEGFVIADIARRIGKEGSLTQGAEGQINRALETGISLEKIEKEIQRRTGAALSDIDREIRSILEEAITKDNKGLASIGKRTVDFNSPGLQGLLTAGLKHTKEDLWNFTRSMGFAAIENGKTTFSPLANYYQDALDTALWQVSTGIIDPQTATREAVKKMANSGLRWVDYDSGHSNRIDVAARRALLTGVNQMNLEMTNLIIDEVGAEYVEVSAHAGARPDHAEWQGKVYHLGAGTEEYPSFEKITGYGTGEGLGGWNCRHTYFLFFPELSKRSYTDEQLKNIDPAPREYEGKTYDYYDATQKQRRMETAMRKTKNELIGYDAAGLEDDFLAASIKLNRQKTEYAKFSSAMNLRMRNDRVQLLGYGRSTAQKAVWANKNSASYKMAEFLINPAKTLKLRHANDIIKINNISDLKNYFKQNFDISIDSYLVSRPFEKVKSASFGVNEILKDFPEAKYYLKNLSYAKGISSWEAKYAGKSLVFSNKSFEKSLHDIALAGIHETIHAADKAYALPGKNLLTDDIVAKAYANLGISKNVKKQEQYTFELLGLTAQKYSKKHISAELLAWGAEAEYKGKGNKLSKELMRLLRRYI